MKLTNNNTTWKLKKTTSTVIIPTDALLCKTQTALYTVMILTRSMLLLYLLLNYPLTVVYLPPLLVIKVILSPAGMSM